MKMDVLSEIKALESLAPTMGGVFSVQDLYSIFRAKNKATFFNKIKKLIKIGILKKFKKEIYTTRDFSSEMLCARIDPSAYISMGSVLAKNGLVGTIPQRVLTAVRLGRNRRFVREDLEIVMYGVGDAGYFGFTKEAGINRADNEKAYLDVLYYRLRGARYVFNELTDIDVAQLDKRRIHRYLERYRNKKFVSFCKKVLTNE